MNNVKGNLLEGIYYHWVPSYPYVPAFFNYISEPDRTFKSLVVSNPIRNMIHASIRWNELLEPTGAVNWEIKGE